MYLFVIALAAAVISGRMAFRFDENRSKYLAVCVAACVMALASGMHLIPEHVWISYAPHFYGAVLVMGFWTLRTTVKRSFRKAVN